MRERRQEARRRNVDVKEVIEDEDADLMDKEDEENERDDDILDKSLLPQGGEEL